MKNLAENLSCTKCDKSFPATADYFYRNKNHVDGLAYMCKICDKKYRQTSAAKESHRKAKKKYNQTLKGKTLKQKNDRNYRQTLKGYLQRVYCHLNRRCTNPKDPDYSRYGGRGIKNKFGSFDFFYAYVTKGLRITEFWEIKGLQIDRRNNDGDYEPGNIRFVTAKVNSNNRGKKNEKPE